MTLAILFIAPQLSQKSLSIFCHDNQSHSDCPEKHFSTKVTFLTDVLKEALCQIQKPIPWYGMCKKLHLV